MRIVLLYHPESDHSRQVEVFAHDFQKLGHGEVELISLETTQGAELAKLYDIVAYPAVLAIRDSGELLKNWEGENLPLINEVAAYSIG